MTPERTEEDSDPQVAGVPVTEMYERLAREYEAEPTVPDRGGGVSGDRYPLDWHHRCDIPACNCGRCHGCGKEMPE